MIQIVFFARLREQLGCSSLELEWSQQLASVQALTEHLQSRDANWSEALGADNIVVAINHQQVDAQQPIAQGDEVAFYPPVTGG